MKAARPYPTLMVSDRCAARLQAGHPWVYDNELLPEQDMAAAENGSLVDLCTAKHRYLGTGFYNAASKIRVRVISDNPNDRFDDAFFRRRLEHAWAYRKTVLSPEELQCCRIIFGEADRFPGLTVDRFGDLLSVQLLSLAMDQRKKQILGLLREILSEDGQQIRGIYLRNDVAVRELEGLSQETGWFWYEGSDNPLTTICENGIIYEVDVANGQKTGFFLDQKYNRRAAASLAKGKTILDCFTHTGSFGLNCAKAGAAMVHSVDISRTAIEAAEHHAQINGVSDRMHCSVADVFDLLREEMQSKKHPYDYIILDPPAFTKSRKTAKNAEKGYLEINTLAMRLLPRGGYLATCSCSHFMTEPMFREMLQKAAQQAGVRIRQIEARQQAPDHPILLSVPETDYLKFFLLQIV